jgi:hypothetical protein
VKFMAVRARRGHVGSTQSNEEGGRIGNRRREVSAGLLAGELGQEMATRLGVSEATISRGIAAVREEWRGRSAADYSALVSEECAKCAEIERVHLPRALAGSASSAHVVLAAMRRRARMLGLDTPQQVQVTAPAVEESPRSLTELFGIEGGDERALARVVCAQLGRGNGDGN